MRIVAISRVLDEADVIEASVRHSAAFVQHHIFVDNGSVDGTLDILRSLKAEGLPISVFQNRCVSFNEANHLTLLFRDAIARHAADWVACLDADEFLDDRLAPGGLRETLAGLAPDVAGVQLPLVEYIATPADAAAEPVVPLRIRRRREPTENCKIIARAAIRSLDVEIMAGGHTIRLGRHPGQILQQTALRLAHYAERSPYQYIVKFVRGWNKVLAAGAQTVASGAAYHYKSPYEVLCDQPEAFLRSDWFMGFKNDAPGLIDDPIAYQGGALRYTGAGDEAMRAVRALMGTVRDLALRHGALLDRFPELRQHVAEWDSELTRII